MPEERIGGDRRWVKNAKFLAKSGVFAKVPAWKADSTGQIGGSREESQDHPHRQRNPTLISLDTCGHSQPSVFMVKKTSRIKNLPLPAERELLGLIELCRTLRLSARQVKKARKVLRIWFE